MRAASAVVARASVSDLKATADRLDLQQNYFDLFGLQTQFNLSTALLSERYRELQRRFHPDRFVHGADAEQLLAVQQAAHLNDAYTTLKAPLKRAQYLFRLVTQTVLDDNSTRMDPAFLMQQMLLREELESARDSSDPEQVLSALGREVAGSSEALYREFERQLDDARAGQSAAAAETIKKLQFMHKLQQEIEQLEDELLDDL